MIQKYETKEVSDSNLWTKWNDFAVKGLAIYTDTHRYRDQNVHNDYA